MAKLDVIIPAYNESSYIRSTCERVDAVLAGLNAEWRIIVVDDGSSDDSWDVICSLAMKNSRIEGLRLSRNFGKEGAIQAGLDHADADAVIVMDADLEHPPAVIAEMLARWRAGALVVHGVKRRAKRPPWRYAGSAAFNWLIYHASGLFLEGSSDFKLLDRRVVEVYRQYLHEKSRFFRGLAEWVGFSRSYVEFTVSTDQDRQSRWHIASLLALAAQGITSFSSRPLHLTTGLGLLQLMVALMLGVQTLWMKLTGRAVSGFTTVILLELLTAGMILIALGIVGEYLKHIYDEVKGRPVYLVEQRIQQRPKDVPSTNDKAPEAQRQPSAKSGR